MKLPDPIAYFDPQEKGFYWAIPIGVFAPTTVTVPPLALYLENALMEVRRAALEEAAKVCDEMGDAWLAAYGTKSEYDAGMIEAYTCASNRIRALIEKGE